MFWSIPFTVFARCDAKRCDTTRNETKRYDTMQNGTKRYGTTRNDIVVLCVHAYCCYAGQSRSVPPFAGGDVLGLPDARRRRHVSCLTFGPRSAQIDVLIKRVLGCAFKLRPE